MANPAFDFVLTQLRKNPKIQFATLRDKAAAKGHTIYPVSFGRAQALLGHVKSKPRKDKKPGDLPMELVASEPTAIQSKSDVVFDWRRTSLNGDTNHALKAIGVELTALRRFKERARAFFQSCLTD